MKKAILFLIVINLFTGLLSCNKLMPVNYDKAYRDFWAMSINNPSLTIQEAQEMLKGIGNIQMSSKDFFTVNRSSPSLYTYLQMLSLDWYREMYKDYNIDYKNLERALLGE